MNSYSLFTIDISSVDYADLLALLRLCADKASRCSELDDLAADFRFFCDLLESNRR